MRSAAVLLLLVLPVLPAAAQEPLETKLVVTQSGQEIGREEFTLPRDPRPRAARARPSSPTARYPATNPTTRLAATLERTPESALAKFQLDVESAGAVTVILAAGSGARLIVRTVAKGSESGRELPGGPDVVLLDDAVFSLYHRGGRPGHAAGRTADGDLPAHRASGPRSRRGASRGAAGGGAAGSP